MLRFVHALKGVMVVIESFDWRLLDRNACSATTRNFQLGVVIQRYSMATKPSIDYTVTPNSVNRGESRTSNKLISISARWLLSYCIGRPPGWIFRRSHLAELAGVSEKKITRLFAELVEAGLCKKEQVRGKGGELGSLSLTFHPIVDTEGQNRPTDEVTVGQNTAGQNRPTVKNDRGTKSTYGTVGQNTVGQNTAYGEMSRLVITEGVVTTEVVVTTDLSPPIPLSTEGTKRANFTDQQVESAKRMLYEVSHYGISYSDDDIAWAKEAVAGLTQGGTV